MSPLNKSSDWTRNLFNKSLILCILYGLGLPLAFQSCSLFTIDEPEVFSGGVTLSFDDNNIDEWQWADSILNEYNWKATFCVSGFDRLSENEINKLEAIFGYVTDNKALADQSVPHPCSLSPFP